MIRILILLGCYASFWANMPLYGWIMQAAFLVLFLVASFIAFAEKRVLGAAPSLAEIVLYGAAALSTAVGLIRSDEYTTLYSALFLAALILISLVSRAITLEQLLDIGAGASLLGVLTCLLVDGHSLLKALSISVGRTGLFRFSPLNTHPDLAGLLYGSCSILMARRAYIAKGAVERGVMISGVVLAGTYILAASARASLLALAVASVAAVVLEIRPRLATYMKLAAIGLAAICVTSLVSASRLVSYLQGILELNSKYRGAATGGSGRTEIWQHGISALFQDPTRLIFGGGLRSSESSAFGWASTENSYISILLDSGAFVGTAIISVYIYSAIKAWKLSQASYQSNSQIFLFAYVVFLLAESFFNRYLLAIGNAGSLLALMILISLSIRKVPARELNAATSRAASECSRAAPKPDA